MLKYICSSIDSYLVVSNVRLWVVIELGDYDVFGVCLLYIVFYFFFRGFFNYFNF